MAEQVNGLDDEKGIDPTEVSDTPCENMKTYNAEEGKFMLLHLESIGAPHKTLSSTSRSSGVK